MITQAGLIVLSLAVIAQGDRRVFGGHDAPNHKYPFLASFRRPEIGHFCAGSILNKHWILTAAHCLQNVGVNSFIISAGTNFLNESGTIYEPKFFIVHEQYREVTQFDVALIRVKRDIVFTDFVKTIGLATKDTQDFRKPFIHAGWGWTQWEQPSASPVLQEIYINPLIAQECIRAFDTINDRHICTWNKPSEGICHGDSGGPLLVDGVQVGIASYGHDPCGNYPDVWTRVFSYRDWILKKMNDYDNV